MTNFREIIRKHIIAETEQELESSNVSKSEIPKMLSVLDKNGHIDNETDKFLDAFRNEIEKNSPKKKKQKIITIGYAAINLILTALIGYAVNEDAWNFVWGLVFVNVILHALFIFIND
ncbi:MAG: hypothetical protein GX072_10940 [Lysinibacillus sp.]|nr:hypothetical protein [Lysinibacillus sp.]